MRTAIEAIAPVETPAKMPSSSSSLLRPDDRVVVGDEDLPVQQREVDDRRDEAVVERAQALHGLALHRLGGDDLHRVAELLAQAAADAHQRPAGAEAGHEAPTISSSSSRISGAGAVVVRARVRLVAVLVRHVVRGVLGRHLQRHRHGAVGAQVARRVDDLRAVHLQQLRALGRHVVGHDDLELVALARADHRQRDAGVARGRLEDRLAGADRALLLGVLDQRARDAVLDRARRVERLHLRPQADARLGREALELDERRVADRLDNVAVAAPAGTVPQFLGHDFRKCSAYAPIRSSPSAPRSQSSWPRCAACPCPSSRPRCWTSASAGWARRYYVCPSSWEQLRHEEGGAGRPVPYWARPWPSGVGLAGALYDDPPPAGTTVLELGCGLALPSVMAARAGARRAGHRRRDRRGGVRRPRAGAQRGRGRGRRAWTGQPTETRSSSAGRSTSSLAADVLYTRANVEAANDAVPAPGCAGRAARHRRPESRWGAAFPAATSSTPPSPARTSRCIPSGLTEGALGNH